MSTKPLDRFPAIRTTDVDEMREAIAKRYGENNLHLQQSAKGFHGYTNRRPLTNIALAYETFGAGVVQQFQMFNRFAQKFRIRGASETVGDHAPAQLASHQSLIASPGANLKVRYSPDYEHCVLTIDGDALRNKLTALIGRQPRRDFKLEPIANLLTPESTYLRRLVMFLLDQLGSPDCAIPPLALVELEQAVLVAFLCANRHTESHLLDRDPIGTAPWQVRRAEEYIEAHWDQPITVEALAIATSTSVRSIFHSFKASRGYSPMAFVKQVRLRHARGMLLMPHENTSVTNVAFDCGFTNLGNFAKDYGRCFGELPSATHNRAKGAIVRRE